MLIFIFQCILGLHSQIIDFKNDFSQSDITRWEPVFIELLSDLKSDWGKHDVVLILKKILYGQAKDAYLWYEKLLNVFLDCAFVISKVDTWLSMSKTMICVVYVDDFLF